jgi:hypothetical protein
LKFEQKMGIALIDEVRFYGEEATNANVDIYYSTDDVIYTQITTADIQTQSTVSTGAGASKIWQAGDAGKSMVIGRINGAGNPYNFTEGIVNRVDVKLSNGGVGNAQLKLGICRQVGAYFRLVGPVASATIGGGAWYTFNFSPAVIIGADDYLVLHAHGALGDVYIYGGSLATSFYYGSWDIDTVESMALASLTAGANTAIINVDTYHGYKGEDFSAAPIEAKYWKLEHAVPASLSRKIFSLSVIAHPDTVDFYEDAGGLTPVFPEPVDEGSYTPGVYKEYTKYAKFTSDPPAGTSSGAVGMADPDPNFINYGIEVSFSAVFATVCRHCANNNLISCAASNTNWKLKANPDNGVAGCGMGCPDWTQTAMVSYAAVINDGDLIPFYVRTYYEEIINEEGGALIGFII